MFWRCPTDEPIRRNYTLLTTEISKFQVPNNLTYIVTYIATFFSRCSLELQDSTLEWNTVCFLYLRWVRGEQNKGNCNGGSVISPVGWIEIICRNHLSALIFVLRHFGNSYSFNIASNEIKDPAYRKGHPGTIQFSLPQACGSVKTQLESPKSCCQLPGWSIFFFKSL